ncbi:hypothetical protein SpAn4DRAFT_4844 [Sporomusa ovata]|uniref:Uncharacterized protein n=1 Tax=Sporomusa ovata TaxID=2378 RepID=A0A0U1KS46_9FIRM|nr:hypothetical protein SpAn4DRAFT_4844 [Sporomusa ovata]
MLSCLRPSAHAALSTNQDYISQIERMIVIMTLLTAQEVSEQFLMAKSHTGLY